MIRTGEQAPGFELPDQDGRPVSLESLRGRPVALCFYPKNKIFGCPSKKSRRMAESVSAAYAQIKSGGAEVLAVSSDSVESQRRFVTEHCVPYRHLSDPGKGVCRQYAGLGMAGLARRATVIIDGAGLVREVMTGMDVSGHGGQLAGALQKYK